MNTSEVIGAVAAVSVSQFGTIDYSVFGLLLAISLGIGLYFGCFSNQEQTTEEYLQGGHKMQPLPIAISLVASQLSAISIMAVPAEIYSFGWQFMLLLPSLVGITLAANYLFIPVFYQNNIDNCLAYLELRFSKTVRNLMTASYLLIGIFFLPLILYIPSLAFVEVTGHNLYVVNGVVCSCCIIYTMMGGIKAVVWTDVVQAGVMVISIVLIACYGIASVGGLTEVWNRAVDGGRLFPPIMSMDLTTRQTFWNMTMGTFLIWSCHLTFSQSCVQRIVALPTLGDSRRALVLFCFGVVSIMFINCFTGIIMFAYYYDCDPLQANMVSKADKMIPRFVQDVVGHIAGMPGVFISCVFSASLSTVSANVNSLAGLIYLDFIKPLKFYRHTERRAHLIMKTIIVLLGIECAAGALIVEKFSSIFQLMNTIAGMTTGPVFGVFTIGMLYPFANKHGALCSVIIAMAALGSIIINTQIAIGNDELIYDAIPTSIEGCTNATRTAANLVSQSAVPQVDDGFAFYKISFMWYGPLGAAITWISCIVISYLTGGQDLNELDLNLLAPCIRNLLPKKYRHMQLQVLVAKSADETVDGDKNELNASKWVWKNDEKNQIK